MKIKLILLSCMTLILVSGCAVYSKPRPPAKWQDAANWDKLEVGMNVAQVRALLGRPPYMGDFYLSDYENWYYPTPEGGIVQISDKRRVVAFRRPSFD